MTATMRFIAISWLSLPEIRRRSVGLLPSKRRVAEAPTGPARSGRPDDKLRVVPTKACDEEARFEVSILLLGCVRNSGRYSAMFNAMARRSRVDRPIAIGGAAHSGHRDNPAAFKTSVTEFLARHERRILLSRSPNMQFRAICGRREDRLPMPTRADVTDNSGIESKVRGAAGRCGRLNDDEASLPGFLGPARGCGDCFLNGRTKRYAERWRGWRADNLVHQQGIA